MITMQPDMSTADKRTLLNEALATGVSTVTFIKVNGEVRVMPCTLDPALLPPPPPLKEGATPKKENPDVLRVFCTDKNEFRSFRIDNVLTLSPGDTNGSGTGTAVL